MTDKRANRPTKGLMSRLASCQAVLSALETHGPRMVEILGGPSGPVLEEVGSTPFEPLLVTLGGRLENLRDRMIVTDRDNRDQKAMTSKYRRKRNTAFAELNKKVVGLRDTVLGVYNPEIVEQVGFAARTPETPKELAEQTMHLVARLREPDLEAATAKFENIDLDIASLAGELTPLAEGLTKHLEKVEAEESVTEATIIARKKALEVYDREFLWIARTLESLFRLAELPEEAAHVRPSTRRRGLTVEVESEDPETETEDTDATDVDDPQEPSGDPPPDDPPIAA